MRLRVPLVVGLAILAGGCGSPLGREYEYEEQLYLSVDGSATVIVSGSIPALVALRGLPLDPEPAARVSRQDVRDVFQRAGCDITSAGQPWRRHGRRFVQVRIETHDVRTLSNCRALAWSSYAFGPGDEGAGTLRYRQVVGEPATGDPGDVNWNGREVIGFKLHIPSRIQYHNVKRLEDGENGEAERGNILTFEQRLADRRAGVPIEMDVVMGSESILYRTLTLFAGAFLAAVVVLGLVIWLTVRRGRKRART